LDETFTHQEIVMALYSRLLILLVIIVSSASGQNILFQERFTNGAAENVWLAGFNGTALTPYQSSLSPGDGWVGRLLNKASGGNVAQSSAENQNFSDFNYEASIYVPTNAGTYYGIEFRGDPSGLSSGYQFVAAFNPAGTQRMRFRVRPFDNPSIPVSLKDWSAAEIPGGVPTASGWHTFAVKAVGPHFWFYFDGQEMPGGLNFDQTFTSGTVGVYLWDMSSPDQELLVDNMKVTAIGVSSVPDAAAPGAFSLSEAYPNPVSAPTGRFRIDGSFPTSAPVEAVLLDGLGRAMRTSSMRPDASGIAAFTLNTAGLPAGVFTVRVSQNGRVQQRRFVVVR
jgi:hypothetical protein